MSGATPPTSTCSFRKGLAQPGDYKGAFVVDKPADVTLAPNIEATYEQFAIP